MYNMYLILWPFTNNYKLCLTTIFTFCFLSLHHGYVYLSVSLAGFWLANFAYDELKATFSLVQRKSAGDHWSERIGTKQRRRRTKVG